MDGSKYLGVTVTDNFSCEETLSTAPDKSKTLHTFRLKISLGVCISCEGPLSTSTWTSPAQGSLLCVHRRYISYTRTRHIDGPRAWLGKPSGQMPDFQTQHPLQSASYLSLVDIDKRAYLKPGDSRTRSTQDFTRSTLRMMSITTHSSLEQSGNGTEYQTAWPHRPPGWLPCHPVHQARPSLNHDQLPHSSHL